MFSSAVPVIALVGETAVLVIMLMLMKSIIRDQVAERAALLQRIQAPAAATVSYELAQLPASPAPMEYDNDEDFHSSREDLVEALKRSGELLV